MDIGTWLDKSVSRLEAAGIATARLDCLVLLEDALGKNRTHLLANPDMELSSRKLSLLNAQIVRRAEHEPLAYIRGKSEFYGRDFLVNTHTLEPRPETETMVEMLLSLEIGAGSSLADIGTGSGCIAITAKLEAPGLDVFATDIDAHCITTASRNAQALQADITFYKGDLLEPLHGLSISALVCNLPYVPARYELNKAARFEPRHAIFGGQDGLDLYRKMFGQIDAITSKPVHILTESLPFQHKTLSEIAQISGYKLAASDDFIQHFTLDKKK